MGKIIDLVVFVVIGSFCLFSVWRRERNLRK